MDNIIRGVAQAIQENNADIERKLSTLKREIKSDLTVALAQDFSNELIKEYKQGKVYNVGTIVRHRGGLFQAFTDTDAHPMERDSGWACVTNGVADEKFEIISTRERKLTTELSDGTILERTWKEPIPIHKGTWSADETYETGDEVIWGGATYRAVADVISTEPSTSDEWKMVAQRGKPGKQGIQGDRGEKGDKGESGKDADPMVAAKIVMRELVKEVNERLNDE